MRAVDLHTHTSKSDGTFTPTEIVDYAIEKGLAAIAITDHDTVDGLDEAIEYAKQKNKKNENLDSKVQDADSNKTCKSEQDSLPGIEVVPGIELSTEYQGKDIHMVGLYIDHQNQTFQNSLTAFVESRINRNYKMCANLQKAGIDITFDRLMEENPGAVITRAHYGAYLVKHGYVLSKEDAFSKYLGDDTPYFVPREKITPKQGVELILSAGGVPILAHPTLYHMSDDRLRILVSELKEVGLAGIECVYSTYNNQDERRIKKIAKDYALLPSGGSDFHGTNKTNLDLGTGYGHLFVPEEYLTNIKALHHPA